MVVLYQPKYSLTPGQWGLRAVQGLGSGPGADVLVLLWVVVESQNGLGFWIGTDFKNHLVPTPFHGQRHRPHRMLLGLCLGTRAAGKCLCHPSAALGMETGEFCQCYSLRQPRREHAGGRGGGKVEGTQGSKEKPAGPSLLLSVLQEEGKPISWHFQHDWCTCSTWGWGLGVPASQVGMVSQTVTNSSQPVAFFCDDSQACASNSAPSLGQTPVIIVFIFLSLVLEGSWM